MSALRMSSLTREDQSIPSSEPIVSTKDRAKEAARRALVESLEAALTATVVKRKAPRITRVSRLDRGRQADSVE